MRVKVVVEVTEEEITILEKASKIIDNIAEDIDNEDIRTFGRFEEYELRNVANDIDEIIDTFKKEVEKNG